MKIVNKFKGLDGNQLLALVTDDGSAVDINGEGTILIPRVKTFANRAEIATNDDADFVSVQTRFMAYPVLVKIMNLPPYHGLERV